VSRVRRLLWIVNHRTLMQAEVPILRELGHEVFVPKIIPGNDPEYRSGAVTLEYDASLSVPPTALRVLNSHDFYRRGWSPTLTGILDRYFDVLVTSVSAYITPLSEATRKFRGTVVARVFGREHPRRYSELLAAGPTPLIEEIGAMGRRFVFGQGYPNLAEIEAQQLRERAETITVPLPAHAFEHQGQWTGRDGHAIFLCPQIRGAGYYREVYDGIKRDFGDFPHRIFGRQVEVVDDPAVLPYLSDDALLDLYRGAPVFVYPSTEPRHVHYSPLEAMVVGTPVLYRRGALLDVLTHRADLPGACADTEEMRAKGRALLGGDRRLAEAVRSAQGRVLEHFTPRLAREQWVAALGRAAAAA
jgi:hypothetical protein